jgi:hypothetical protein
VAEEGFYCLQSGAASTECRRWVGRNCLTSTANKNKGESIMADITISRRKLLRTIHSEFQETYPFLGLAFFTPAEWNKAREKGGKVTCLPGDKKLAELCPTPPPKDERDLSIRGNTLVKTLEDNFLNAYGLHVQVTYSKGGKSFYTSGEADSMNLANLNKKLEAEGYDKNPAY